MRQIRRAEAAPPPLAGGDATPARDGNLEALLREARERWGLEVADGVQLIAAERLPAGAIEPTRALVIFPEAHMPGSGAAGLAAAIEREPLPGRHGPHGRQPLDILRRLYPPDHRVGRFGQPDDTTIAALTSADLARGIFLAPASAEEAVASPWALPWISARLRRPDGCPWDREQTHESLRKHLLEESYEVYDALAAGATLALAEELGDLLLQVILHAQLAAEEGVFDLTDVYAAIGSKIVRRHPHVFGDAQVGTAREVNRQWERIKSAEREAAAAAADEAGTSTPPKSALDGISPSLPALAASQEMQERAANLGYDWPSIEGVLDKVREELDELRAAESPDERSEEFGDLLMVLVNVARKDGIEAEAALRAANDKFRRRFRSVERQAMERSVALRDLDFAALDALWDAAKIEERTNKQRAEESRR